MSSAWATAASVQATKSSARDIVADVQAVTATMWTIADATYDDLASAQAIQLLCVLLQLIRGLSQPLRRLLQLLCRIIQPLHGMWQLLCILLQPRTTIIDKKGNCEGEEQELRASKKINTEKK